MMAFREFVQTRDIKMLVFDALDPDGDSINRDSDSVLSRPLSDFKRRKDILNSPAIADIVNRSKNRGALISAIDDRSTTIGNLVSMLATG